MLWIAGLAFLAAPVVAIAALLKASEVQRQIIGLGQQVGQLRREIEEMGRQRPSPEIAARAAPLPQGDHVTADAASRAAEVPGDIVDSMEEAIRDTVESRSLAPDADGHPEVVAAPLAPEQAESSAADAPISPSPLVADAAEPSSLDTPPPDNIAAATIPGQPLVDDTVPAPPSDVQGVERAFATRWAIWIGGIALAMGGLLIVRFTIEAGFFGPKVRLGLGAAFALALAVAAEVIRRRELRIQVGQFRAEDVPSVLAGASVISGFGVVFAAHAVYHFIGPALAFGLMGAIGIAALAVSLVYGRALGLLGLLGSYVTPVLVSSAAPNIMALSVFVAVVTTVAVLVELRRPSPTLLAGAVSGHTAWTALIALSDPQAIWGPLLLIVAAAAASLRLELAGLATSNARGRQVDAAALLAPLVLGGVLWVHQGGDLVVRLALAVLVAANLAAAIRIRGLAFTAPIAAAAATGFILLWPSGGGAVGVAPQLLLDMLQLEIAPTFAPGLHVAAALFAALVAAPPVIALLTRYRNGGADPVSRGCLGFAAALAPVAIALAASLRINGFERTPAFALVAALLAIALAALSELLFRTERGGGPPRDNPLAYIASAAHATGAAVALGLAIAFALRETWLVVGFAVASAGVALVARVRPIPLLRSIAATLASAAMVRLAWRPIVSDLGTLPLANWLLPAYGLPALSFAVAAFALRARRDRALAIAEGLAAFFLTALVLFEIAQAFVGADLGVAVDLVARDLRTDPSALTQDRATGLIALGSIACTLLSALFMRLRRSTASPVFGTAETILAVALVPITVIGLGILANPLLSGMPVDEPPLVNRLLFGHVGTGLVFGLLSRALFPNPEADGLLRPILEGLAILLVALGATLMLRHVFSGPYLTDWTSITAAYFESVSMILLWLTLAAATALWRRRRPSDVLGWGLGALCAFAGAGTVVSLGILHNPLFDHSGVAGPILFNRILWGYAPVSIGCLVVARIIGAADLARAMRGLGIATAGVMAFLLLRHGFHGPTLYSAWPITLAEAGIYGAVALSAAFGAVLLKPDLGRPDSAGPSPLALSIAAVAATAAVLAVAAIGHAPLVGWPLINNATVGVLMPAALAGLFSWRTQARNFERSVQRAYGAAAVVGGLIYVLLQVRLLFPPTDLLNDWIADPNATRFYGYSLGILAYGVALLVAGLYFSQRDLRLAALGVIALAVFKVFLLDLAGLEGLARAASFIGLGASLIGVAYLYRWLMPPDGAAAKSALPPGE
ncbi:MAG: DUF2339 domain-containing protein [Xanthobacteraceae bacterium]|nr:DUF2339 domain-containing protein [Xanthobacteraceae bacterium]